MAIETRGDTVNISIRELWSLFDRAHFAVARLRELELAQHGLTIEQASILYILTRLGGRATVKELENETMRQHHSISVLVNGMTRMGLVYKIKDTDNRRYRITISEEGQALYGNVTTASIKESFSVLSDQEQAQLKNYLFALLIKSRELLGKPNGRLIEITREEGFKQQVPPVREIWTLLERSRFAISRLWELELARFGVTIEQTSILNIITHSDGPVTTNVLEDVTMRQQHSISSLINGMAEMGLVRKNKKEGDRKYNITLSKKGQQLFEKMTLDSLKESFSVLTEEERQKLADYLEIILKRARYLLGIPYQAPFMRYLDKRRQGPGKADDQGESASYAL